MDSARIYLLLLLSAIFFAGESVAVNIPPINNSYLTANLRPKVDLSDYWRDNLGRSYKAPFAQYNIQQHKLDQVFYLDSLSKCADTLFLYLSGLAWTSEIYLNKKLLQVNRDPFSEWLIPLPKTLFNSGRNEMNVLLKSDGSRPSFYPQPFTGLIGQIVLMEEDTIYRLPEMPPLSEDAGKVMIYAPWSKQEVFKPDPAMFWMDLKEMKEAGVTTLWFPFRPHGKYFVMMKKAGMSLATDLESASEVAFFNEYPLQNLSKDFRPYFWKDEAGNPTEYYGKFQIPGKPESHWLQIPSKPALILLLIIPLLGILCVKLFGARIYLVLSEFVTKSKIYVDLIGKNKFLKIHESVLMNTFRMVMVSAMIALPLYYVQCTGNYDWLNVLASRSVLYTEFSFADLSLIQYFGLSLLFVFGMNMLKYSFIYIMGLIFGISGFASGLQNMDIFLFFPLSLILFIPIAFLFFVAPSTLHLMAIGWVLAFLLISIRRLLLIYMGLGNLYGLPTSLKILYICAFEFLPWIILL